MMDEVWLVYVNETTQIERLMSRNGYTKEDALARINSQMRLDDKRSYADVIIDNNGTPQALTAKLDTIWSERLELLLQKPQ
jgi:dephospho-coA kinase